MGMVRVQEDWIIVFPGQTPHHSGHLPDAKKFPLSLRGADSDRDFEVPRGGHHRLQQNQVCHVEVADRYSVLFALLQSISQSLHAGAPPGNRAILPRGLLTGLSLQCLCDAGAPSGSVAANSDTRALEPATPTPSA